MRIRVLAALALLSLSSCTSIAPNDHRLTGRIWEPASGTFVERDRVLAQAVAADAVLLGETHDNPEHHALQAWVVRELVAAGRKPVVAFEM
ncbi:MAG TPA: ChaN family lipoprotein, partial [Candidatus Omnitrophota bacterium]|nr:ChaN family lipoprotein [Candidatus Omnitrophota bacterium]